ncbi:MAG: DUF928 domain-containing protein [Microcoleaceae cyanobacterium]
MNSNQEKLLVIKKIGISTAVISLLGWQLGLQAKNPPPFQVAVDFPSAPDRGAPSRTGDGGTRSATVCIAPNAGKITAVVPNNNVATTVATNPSIFVYMPENKAKSAEITISDAEGNDVYSSKLAINNDSGIIRIDLPDILKSGRIYDWQVVLNCTNDINIIDLGSNPSVQGKIETLQVSNDLQTQLATAQANSLELAKIYAKAGVWQETLKTLADLRNQYPKEWAELLQSVGLDALSQENISNCCQVSQ